MSTNAIGGALSPTSRMCVFLALPKIICAPQVPTPSSDAGDDATEGMPRYLRRVAARNYDVAMRDGSGDDSSLLSLVSLLRSATGREEDDGRGGDRAVLGDELDLEREIEVDPVRLRPDADAEGLPDRRLQQATEKWYVNWFESKCVQSCPPTPDNPNCAGDDPMGQLLYDTAEYCCRINLGWLPLEDCAPDDAVTALSESGGETISLDSIVDSCLEEYSRLNEYESGDLVTVYFTETKGNVFRCKEGSLSQYCDVFPPDWSVTAAGGASVHKTDALGWEQLGDCEDEQVALVSPAGNSTSGASSDDSPGGGDRPLSTNFQGLSVIPAASPVELDPSIGKEPAQSKPVSYGNQEEDGGDVGRPIPPDRPGKPSRPYKPKPAVQAQQGSDPNNEDEDAGSSPESQDAPGDINDPGTGHLFNDRPLTHHLGLTIVPDDSSSELDTTNDPVMPSIGKKPAEPKPVSYGNQEEEAGGDVGRPIPPDRPGKPIRPYKPKPAVQAQQGPDPNNEDGGGGAMIEKDGVYCYRSGTRCISDAEAFACCTSCINTICI